MVLFLVLCEVSEHVFVHIRAQSKNSSRTTVRTFSNFNLLRGRCMCGRCTLLPFPPLLRHYALLLLYFPKQSLNRLVSTEGNSKCGWS